MDDYEGGYLEDGQQYMYEDEYDESGAEYQGANLHTNWVIEAFETSSVIINELF